jgi:RNA exonuclease 1
MLAKTHLEIDIQQAGAAGHDSYEDARTTGELVRFKIKEKWKTMKIDGWQIREDGVFPPVPVGTPPAETVPLAPSMVPEAKMAVLEGKKAEKRKADDDGAEEVEGEPPVKKQA